MLAFGIIFWFNCTIVTDLQGLRIEGKCLTINELR